MGRTGTTIFPGWEEPGEKGENLPHEVRTERDMRLPHELEGGYPATFRKLRGLFRARGISPEEAADLAQETIARTLLHLQRRSGRTLEDTPEHLDPLLRRIATNLLIDRARAATPQLVPIEGAEDVSSGVIDPSEEVARRHQQAQVHTAIDGLANRHRTAMLLSLEGLTPAEIADHLGIRRNAADALLYRARRSLARNLSAIAGLIRGLAILAALKVRSAGRRAGELARAGEPLTIVGGQTAFGIAAATLGAALTFAAPTTDARAVETAPPATVGTAGATDAPGDVLPPADVATETTKGTTHPGVAPDAAVDTREHRVSADATIDDGSGEQGDVFDLDVWHERDAEERGAAGPMLDSATDAACSAADACDP